jgi:TonB family protein
LFPPVFSFYDTIIGKGNEMGGVLVGSAELFERDGQSRWRKAFFLSILLHAGAFAVFNYFAPVMQPQESQPLMVELEGLPQESFPESGGNGIGSGGTGIAYGDGALYGGDGQIYSAETAEAGEGDDILTEAAPAVPVENSSGAVSGTAGSKEAAEKEIARKEEAGGGSFDPYSILINSGSGGPSLGRSAKLLHAEYPAAGTATYKGRVNISACIGTDGKIRYAEVVHSSGSKLVDAIAMSCAKKWIYRPATDKNGTPIECNALISIPFREKKEK